VTQSVRLRIPKFPNFSEILTNTTVTQSSQTSTGPITFHQHILTQSFPSNPKMSIHSAQLSRRASNKVPIDLQVDPEAPSETSSTYDDDETQLVSTLEIPNHPLPS
jgi:hypothetical protein